MIEWPYYEVEFERGPVITVASSALPSALVDAVAIANRDEQLLEPDPALQYLMTDVVSVRQLGMVYISDAIEQTLTAARLDAIQSQLDEMPSEDSFFDEEVRRSGDGR